MISKSKNIFCSPLPILTKIRALFIWTRTLQSWPTQRRIIFVIGELGIHLQWAGTSHGKRTRAFLSFTFFLSFLFFYFFLLLDEAVCIILFGCAEPCPKFWAIRMQFPARDAHQLGWVGLKGNLGLAHATGDLAQARPNPPLAQHMSVVLGRWHHWLGSGWPEFKILYDKLSSKSNSSHFNHNK